MISQPTPPAGPDPDDPEAVYRAILAAAVRPAIRAASAGALRAAHAAVAGHLHHYLSGNPCDAASTTGPPGIQAGFRLSWHAEQAIAATLMLAVSTGQASVALATVRRMRHILMTLADTLDTLLRDADIAVQTSTAADLPDDLWHAGAVVTTAVSLHRHATRNVAVHVLYDLWNNLTCGCEFPATTAFPAPGYHTIPLN
jgi:hypothetical protein